MEDDKLYRQALEEMKELAERVLEECCEFAEDNDYEKEWDLLYDKFGVADDVSYLTFDNGYYLQTNEEIETPKDFESLDDLATTIELLEKTQEEIEALRLGENLEKE